MSDETPSGSGSGDGQTVEGAPAKGKTSQQVSGASGAGANEIRFTALESKMDQLADMQRENAERWSALTEIMKDSQRAASPPASTPDPAALEAELQKQAEQLDLSPQAIRWMSAMMENVGKKAVDAFRNEVAELRNEMGPPRERLDKLEKDVDKQMTQLRGSDIWLHFLNRHPELQAETSKPLREKTEKYIVEFGLKPEKALEEAAKHFTAEEHDELLGGDQTTAEEKERLKKAYKERILKEYLESKKAVSEGKGKEETPEERFSKPAKKRMQGLRDAIQRDRRRELLDVGV